MKKQIENISGPTGVCKVSHTQIRMKKKTSVDILALTLIPGYLSTDIFIILIFILITIIVHLIFFECHLFPDCHSLLAYSLLLSISIVFPSQGGQKVRGYGVSMTTLWPLKHQLADKGDLFT